MSNDLYWVAVALVVTVTTSRLTRLWTYDDFPPVAWVRGKYLDFADKHAPGWAELGFCPWCCGFWIALAVIGCGYAAGIYEWTGPESGFWTVAGALSASYLAAMIQVRDGDTSRDSDTDGDDS